MREQTRSMTWNGRCLITALRMKQDIRLTGLKAMRITMAAAIPNWQPLHSIIGIQATVMLLIYQVLRHITMRAVLAEMTSTLPRAVIIIFPTTSKPSAGR